MGAGQSHPLGALDGSELLELLSLTILKARGPVARVCTAGHALKGSRDVEVALDEIVENLVQPSWAANWITSNNSFPPVETPP